ncbi:site-2 protease family protein [Candidatus Peregrinibacteria bacterium]|nr:site-2 protease family protein [Candidatus Peregrinibacteria bacterium]
MDILQFLYFVIALLITLTVHEASHALVAYYLGDPTAKMQGRLTLNPLKHLDPIGALVLLWTRFIGWAKPVPINPAYFKSPMRDSALTALAGPFSNFLLAFVVALPWAYLGAYMTGALLKPVLTILQMIFHVSISLGIFNLLPFPPLDGSKVIGVFIPRRFQRNYQNYLAEGAKYFIVIIIVDALIVGKIRGIGFIPSIVRYLNDWVAAILLLGT